MCPPKSHREEVQGVLLMGCDSVKKKKEETE
jgi:hypothetical protein